MRVLVLVPLLVVGGLFLATGVDLPAGSNVGPVAQEVTALPSATPAPSPEVDGAGGQATPPAEPGVITHRPAVLEQFLCTNCHSLNGGWLLPDSHRDIATQACENCHAPAPNPAPVVIHYTPGDTATQGLCTLCHSVGRQGQNPPIAPVVSAAQACASCHSGDQKGVPPQDHAGRSVATCTLCHETQQLTAKPVPHQVEGWGDCRFCHGAGLLTPLAGGHKDIPENECLNCHQTSETPPNMPLTMADHADAKGGCTSCHSENQLAPLPASHEGRSELLCTVCHRATTTEAPLVPHPLTLQSACISCHSPKTLPVTLKAHGNPLDEACTACHRQVPTLGRSIGGLPSE